MRLGALCAARLASAIAQCGELRRVRVRIEVADAERFTMLAMMAGKPDRPA